MTYIAIPNRKGEPAVGPFPNERAAADWLNGQRDGECVYHLQRLIEPASDECAVCGGPAADHGLLNGYPDKHAFTTEAREDAEGHVHHNGKCSWEHDDG